MSSFLELLKVTSGEANNELRQQYESKLLSYRQQDPTNFLRDCVNTFNDGSLDMALRQVVVQILKISLASEIVTCPHERSQTRGSGGTRSARRSAKRSRSSASKT